MDVANIHDKMIDDAISEGKKVAFHSALGQTFHVESSLLDSYKKYDARRYENIPVLFSVLFLSVLGFWSLNKILARFLSSSSRTPKENRALVNNAVSLVHSTVATCLIHYDFKILNPIPLMTDDLRLIHSDVTLFLVAFCGGYFLYDTLDIRTSASGRALVELLCHHAIIIITYTYVLYRREYVAFCAAFLFCETNSIFLHMRQLMLYNKIPKTSFIFRVNAIINYATFTVYRLINCFWLLMYMYNNFGEFDFIVRVLMVGSVPAITIVQLPLLYRIIYSDWFKTNTQSSKMNFD